MCAGIGTRKRRNSQVGSCPSSLPRKKKNQIKLAHAKKNEETQRCETTNYYPRKLWKSKLFFPSILSLSRAILCFSESGRIKTFGFFVVFFSFYFEMIFPFHFLVSSRLSFRLARCCALGERTKRKEKKSLVRSSFGRRSDKKKKKKEQQLSDKQQRSLALPSPSNRLKRRKEKKETA